MKNVCVKFSIADESMFNYSEIDEVQRHRSRITECCNVI